MIELKELNESYINQLFALQEEVFGEGYTEDLLRHNKLEDFQSAFKYNHNIVGYFDDDQLISFGMLYNSNKNEVLSQSELNKLASLCENKKQLEVGVIKLIIVKKEFRGKGFQRKILEYFEEWALQNNINLLIASTSPLNLHSSNNFRSMGYSIYKTKKLYGRHERDIFLKFI